MRTRKALSGEQLIEAIKCEFSKIKDHRRMNSVRIPLTDALMSAFAMFLLKFPSLLQFEEEIRKRGRSSNLKSIFQISQIPSDSQMREILDEVDPEQLRLAFNELFRRLQRGAALEQMCHYRGHYFLSIDGTSYFSSNDVRCERCLVKTRSSTGEPLLYCHQMVIGQLLNPEIAEVIPLCPEPVQKQEDNEKNDCERHAVRRFLTKFRKDHPQLKVIVLADSLMSNAPQIIELQNHLLSYILSAKPGNHKDLYRDVENRERLGEVTVVTRKKWIGDQVRKKVTQTFRFVNGVSLARNYPEMKTNFLDYQEIIEWTCKGVPTQEVLHFSWITDIEIKKSNLEALMRGGRARWKIENETFNTLKNQGYNFEHNFGHGNKNLTTIFAYLMILAFFCDQIQSLCCNLFQTAQQLCIRRFRLWKYLREAYCTCHFENWTQLIISIIKSYQTFPDTS